VNSNYYDEGAYRGGVFTLLHNLVYPLTLSSTSQEAQRDPALKAAMLEATHEQIGAWLRAYPFLPNASPLLLSPVNERWFRDFVDIRFRSSSWRSSFRRFDPVRSDSTSAFSSP
jgi:hypothetical protein